MKVAFAVELHELQCKTCGAHHAIPQILYDRCLEHGGYWYCPNGHQWGYSEGSLHRENERLKKELEQLKKRKEWAEQEAKNAADRERAAKGQMTKLKKLIGNGVCPCCRRSFTNLQRHMHTKHPDFKQA